MAERITKKDAERAFETLCKALGKDTRDTVLTDQRTPTGGVVYAGNIGAWRLSWHFNGRCGIEEISTPSWGIHLPFGYRIYTPREFVDCVGFTLQVLEVERQGKMGNVNKVEVVAQRQPRVVKDEYTF